MSTPELRQKLWAFWREWDRLVALRDEIVNSNNRAERRAAKRRALFFVDHGRWPPAPVSPSLPPLPEFPPECVGMICGSIGRRSGRPCQSKRIYPNGRCCRHGGASTGPKMEITDKDRRRLLKAYFVELARVEALRRKILTGERTAKQRAEFFVDHGFSLLAPVLPPLPKRPPECVDMVCGGKGRRSGRPCQCKGIYANGRCRWHGGLSTGPKTTEGKARSQANLRRGSNL
jgi:hypothetical protein